MLWLIDLIGKVATAQMAARGTVVGRVREHHKVAVAAIKGPPLRQVRGRIETGRADADLLGQRGVVWESRSWSEKILLLDEDGNLSV